MMNESPYTAPETATHPTETHSREPFSPLKKMRSAELKKLYNKSKNIGALGGLSFFYAVMLLLARYHWVEPTQEIEPFREYIFFAILLMAVVTMIAMWVRPAWGQTVGYLACGMYILSFLVAFDIISLVFGVVGFCILPSSGLLFGSNRVKHSILKRNYIRRKKEGRYK